MTIDKWSACEVQEVLDEYHLEKRLGSFTESSSRIHMNKVEVSPNATLVSDIPKQNKKHGNSIHDN